MKRPNAQFHRRPASVAQRRPRSRTEAAIELVRAEFERERLQRDLDQLDRRIKVSLHGRDANIARSRILRAMLAAGDAGPVPPSPSIAAGAPGGRLKRDRG